MKKRKGGYTLVELVVVFALIALIALAATTVVATYMNYHTRMRDLGQMEMVADTLLGDIQSNLASGTEPEVLAPNPNISSNTSGSNAIVFRDRNQYHVIISLNYLTTNPTSDSDYDEMYEQNTPSLNSLAVTEGENEMILMAYDRTKKDDDSSLQASQRYSFWSYPQATYMQNKITKLTFTQIDNQTDGKVFRVDLTMENKRTNQVYSETRYVECYD